MGQRVLEPSNRHRRSESVLFVHKTVIFESIGPPSLAGGCGRCWGAGPCSPGRGNSAPIAPAPTGFIRVYKLSPPAAHTRDFRSIPAFLWYQFLCAIDFLSCHRQNYFLVCLFGFMCTFLFLFWLIETANVNNKKAMVKFIYIFIMQQKIN